MRNMLYVTSGKLHQKVAFSGMQRPSLVKNPDNIFQTSQMHFPTGKRHQKVASSGKQQHRLLSGENFTRKSPNKFRPQVNSVQTSTSGLKTYSSQQRMVENMHWNELGNTWLSQNTSSIGQCCCVFTKIVNNFLHWISFLHRGWMYIEYQN